MGDILLRIKFLMPKDTVVCLSVEVNKVLSFNATIGLLQLPLGNGNLLLLTNKSLLNKQLPTTAAAIAKVKVRSSGQLCHINSVK